MAVPTLQEHIYRTRSVQAVQAEAQHNLMQVLFLVMRCRPDGDCEIILKGLRVFSHLFKVFFKATHNMEVSASNLCTYMHVYMYTIHVCVQVCVLCSNTLHMQNSNPCLGLLSHVLTGLHAELTFIFDIQVYVALNPGPSPKQGGEGLVHTVCACVKKLQFFRIHEVTDTYHRLSMYTIHVYSCHLVTRGHA